MAAADRTFDAIISTVSADLKWNRYIRTLKPFGLLLLVGLPENDMKFKAFDFTDKSIAVVGSLVGSPHEIKQMLEVASKHNVVSDVTVYPMDKVNEAIANFREGKPKYRYVLKIAEKYKL